MVVDNPAPASPPRIAIFLSTSGHSGVDRAMRHLIPALAGRGYQVDLLKVRRHGPDLRVLPDGVRVIDTGRGIAPALHDAVFDPFSFQPAYKACAVHLERCTSHPASEQRRLARADVPSTVRQSS